MEGVQELRQEAVSLKERFDAATEAGAKELYELNNQLESPIGFLVNCKEKFVRAHLRELVKHQSQSKQ